MPMFFTQAKATAIAVLLTAGIAWAGDAGITLYARDVEIRRGATLTLHAEHLNAAGDGTIAGDNARFRIALGEAPVTGTVEQLRGKDGGQWDFERLFGYSKDTAVFMQRGTYIPADNLLTGREGVSLRGANYAVTAPTGSFSLQSQTAQLEGGVTGTVRP